MSGTANRDTLKFSLELLRRVPRSKKVTATELQRQLDAIDIVRTQRAIRMQLDTLADLGEVVGDGGRPFGYRRIAKARGFTESPLSDDQVVVDEGASLLFTATYPESLRLARWLDSFGQDLQVVDTVVVEGASGVCHERP
jgi:hypothetical protein